MPAVILMNTPAHIIVNLFLLERKRDDFSCIAATGLGALIPDIPMMIFYFLERVILGYSEATIWKNHYFNSIWTTTITDWVNSIPLLLMGILVCSLFKKKIGVALFMSMLLHSLCDLPLHGSDAHRHFLPFSQFKFVSPISYWDPAYYGHIFFIIEVSMVIFLSIWLLLKQSRSKVMKIWVFMALAFYGLGIGFAILMWV